VPPGQRGALLLGEGPHLAAGLGQVPEVVAAVTADLVLAVAALAGHLAGGHREHAGAHHSHHQVPGRATGRVDEHQHHAAGHQRHRQHGEQHPHPGRLDLRQCGWFLQSYLAVRHFRSGAPRRAAEGFGRHLLYTVAGPAWFGRKIN
jgi:hypothetical protein